MYLVDTYPSQLKWIQQIQTLMRTYWTDQFFMGWAGVDTLYFDVVLIAVVLYLVNRKMGVKLLFILLISGLVNSLAKSYFALPRPCQMDAYVGLYCPSSYGFPSGAAQNAILFAGIVFHETKSRVFRRFSVLFAVFFCFSRIYLGVHYPTDILGGLVLGFILIYLYSYIFPRFEKHWKFAIFILPVLSAFLAVPTELGNTLGIAVGLLLYHYRGWKWPRSSIRVVQLISVLIPIMGFYYLLTVAPAVWTVPLGFFQGFWFTYLGGWWVAKVSE